MTHASSSRAGTWSTRPAAARSASLRTRSRASRARSATRLDAWDVGPETTVVTGGANGTDIIVAEECLARGADAVICLALPPDEFERRSVAGREGDWTERFRALLDRADVRVLPDPPPSEDELFAATNRWIVETARSLDGGPPHALLVWNGKEGDGPGGTRDFVQQLGLTRPRAERPRDRPDAARLRGAADRRRPEAAARTRRRRHQGRPDAGDPPLSRGAPAGQHGDDLVLADYFDYIAGTSTARSSRRRSRSASPWREVQEMYRNLGGKIFSKRLLPLRLRSIYRDGPLARELESFYGADRTLGDPELRSLLLLVLHNTGTDSPWPVSNCTRGKYNRADRYLMTPPDRNLDLAAFAARPRERRGAGLLPAAGARDRLEHVRVPGRRDHAVQQPGAHPLPDGDAARVRAGVADRPRPAAARLGGHGLVRRRAPGPARPPGQPRLQREEPRRPCS